MSYLHLVWSGVQHSPTRTRLTVASLAVGFLLFGVLGGVNAAFDRAVTRLRADRLLVQPRFGEPPLLQSYAPQIQRVQGVKDLTWTNFLSGTFQHPNNDVIIVVTDLPRFLRVRDEYQTGPEVLAAATRNPRGLIVLDTLANRYGWKAGDRITLQTRIPRKDGSRDWTFDVVGIMSNPSNPNGVPVAIGNFEHFDEARAQNTGMVGRFVVRVDSPMQSVQVAREIDRLFLNSSAPTRTLAENEVGQTELSTIGEVSRLTKSVMAGVLLSIFYLSGNVILQAFKERRGELAVLKAMGYSDLYVTRLVMLETLLIYGMSAVIGLTAAAIAYPLLSRALPSVSLYLVSSRLSAYVFLEGLLIAAAMAVLCALWPAWNAARLQIAETLRGHT